MPIINRGTKTQPAYHVYWRERKPGQRHQWVHRQKSNVRTLAEARILEERFRKEVRRCTGSEGATWTTVVEMYLTEQKEKRRLTHSTLHNYETHLRAYTISYFGHRLITEIHSKDILEYLGQTFSESSEATRKANCKYLSVVFRWAIRQGLCQQNPCQDLYFRVPEPELNIWTREQMQLFLNRAKAANHPYYPVWVFALNTGLRACELRGLKWLDIDLENNLIQVRRGWDRKQGYKPTKNKLCRTVPINDALETVIKELKLKTGGHADEPVLPRYSEFVMGLQSEVLQKFLLDNPDLPKIRFHDLRACFLTELLRQKTSIHLTMELAGHTDMKTAKRYYRAAGCEIRGATNVLNLAANIEDGEAKVLALPGRK